MTDSPEQYKQFIDGLAKRRNAVEAQRIREGVWHREPPPDQVKYNELLAGLSQDERELVAQLVQAARDGGMHDVLAFMTEGGYRLSQNGAELAWEPFGTEMYFDLGARAAGQSWPDEQSAC